MTATDLPQPKPSTTTRMPTYYRNMFIFGIVALGLIALVGDHSVEDDQEHSINSGFWGPVTSTMDWCESNYVVTPYVAEFYNTISNIGFLLVPVIGILFHPHLELRFAIGYMSVAIIGIGSGMFHGTLWFSAQLCDELPMLYFVCILYYIIMEHGTVKPMHPRLPWILGIGVTIFTVIYYYYPFPTLFQVGWGIFVFYTSYLCVTKIKGIPRDDRRIGDSGFFVMIISILLWVSEQAFCSPFVRFLKLHAIWHLGTAYAAYTAVSAMWFYRAKYVLKLKAEMKRIMLLPIVSIK